MRLKYKIVIGTVIILVCCICSFVSLESIIRQIRNGVNDNIIVNIYENVRKTDVSFHARQTGKHVQNFASLKDVIDLCSSNQGERNSTVVKGMFFTLEGKTGLSRMVVLDRHYNMLVNEFNGKAISLPMGSLQSVVIKELCNKVADSWSCHGKMISLGGTPVFVVASAVINDDDQVSGFVLCFLSVDSMAKTLSDRLNAHVCFENNAGEIIAGTDDEVIKSLTQKGTDKINSMESVVVQTTAGAYLTHAIPLFPETASSSSRYFVSRNYTNEYSFINKLGMWRYISMAGLIAAAIFFAVMLLGRMLHPLKEATAVLNDISNEISEGKGDLTRRIEVTTNDEVGQLSAGFNTFIEKIQNIVAEIVQNAKHLDESSTELTQVSEHMSDNAAQTSAKADTVSSATENMSANLADVASAMNQSSTNTSVIANAAEQMNSTINIIARNAEKARDIANDASKKSQGASELIADLDKATKVIGQINATINQISEQTNLLALNATIEAARAGTAGKGFAVVANEIKELSKETATATFDIKSQIEEVQKTADTTVEEIKQITEIITNVDKMVDIIATSVEEQSATTKEISKKIAQTSQDILNVNERVSHSSDVSDDISQNIEEVNQAAREMATGTHQVNESAKDMSKMAAKLSEMVTRFNI